MTRITPRQRIAYHEAGHAVVSAAINDAPHLVSIIANDYSRGRSRYAFEAHPEQLVQVHLAGLAAEELLSGSAPRELRGPRLGISILACTATSHIEIPASVDGSDQHLAVQEILTMGCAPNRDSIRTEFERFYAIAKAAVESVWPAVTAVAQALLERSELRRDAFFEAVGARDIYAPVSAVQKANGLR